MTAVPGSPCSHSSDVDFWYLKYVILMSPQKKRNSGQLYSKLYGKA